LCVFPAIDCVRCVAYGLQHFLCAKLGKVLATGCLPLLEDIQIICSLLLLIWLFRLSHSFIFFWFYFFIIVYMVVYFVFYCLILQIMYFYYYVYVFLLLCMFRSRYSVSLDGPGIESRWGARFSAPLHTGPGTHPASCTMGTGSFPRIKSGRGVTLTPHPLLVPLVMKE